MLISFVNTWKGDEREQTEIKKGEKEGCLYNMKKKTT